MFKRTESFLEGITYYCEDALYAGDDFAFVLDGASSVTHERITEAATDAVWFVERWKDYLKTALARNTEILPIMISGAEKIAAEYSSFPGAGSVGDKPSAAVSIVRVKNNYLEYFSLCDTVILVRYKNGKCDYILDERLVVLDNENFERVKELCRKTGGTPVRNFPQVFPYVYQNRNKMNTPGGYAALSHTTDGLETALTGRIAADGVRDILLFSDGFAQSYDLFGIYKTPYEMIEDVSRSGIKKTVKKLQDAQDADPEGVAFVRNKKGDDIAVVYIGL